MGLDMGTTSLKVVAYTLAGEELASRSTLMETHTDTHGQAVQDPEAIVRAATSTLTELAADLAAQGAAIAAIGISAAMHSLIALDDHNTPLTPAMTWMDARPHAQAQALWQTELGKDVYRHTGTPVHAMAPVVKLAWLHADQPELFAKARRFVSIKEYVWHSWFGTWEVDYAMASATGLLDIQTRTWYAPALAYARIDSSALSTLVPVDFARPASTLPFADQLPLADEALCVIGGSDGVLASLAAGAIDGRVMVLTLGTSLALRTGHDEPSTDLESRSFCYILDDHRFVLGGPSNSGGVVLDWLYRNVLSESGEGFAEKFPALCAEAGTTEADDLYCVPYITGERAPIWDETTSAAFVGLKVYHRQPHLMRAAIEGILFNAYWIAQQLVKQRGKPELLLVSGKLFQQPWVLSWIANLFELPLATQAEIDGATYGAAMVAARRAGLALAAPPLQLLPTKVDAKASQQVHRRYKQWRELVRKLL
ncbi:carbohydrate kinase, FGGY-like protein [Alicyclobacillus hesperidum URH17-3-68]|uniref:gluconokinase n=1 Tax=Alicyclobacillus hesperidum TaxID=89784 RepID=UPI000281C0F5|nr:gluconokinase [Alicyclobacillus hesperidum]EJY56675.1 carbohydrate kinase, FGGY-like protein [Alicyclobacillus hesperidum URH17-3-68]